jgi:hypothetical protein
MRNHTILSDLHNTRDIGGRSRSKTWSRRRYFRLAMLALLAPLIMGCSGCPKPAAREVDWGVYDATDGVSNSVPSGGTFKINAGHKYMVVLRAKDPDKVKHMAIWGDGNFTCSTNPNKDGQTFTAPNPLAVSIPKKEVSATDYVAFVISDFFMYDQLSCGRHAYGNTGGPQDFFVTNGTLHFHGEMTNMTGTTTTATLDLTP